MKNIFTIVAVASMMFASTQSFAQTSKDVTGTVNNTVNQVSGQATNIVDKTSNGIGVLHDDVKDLLGVAHEDLKVIAPKIESAITEIAKGLKTGAANVWEILVKQQLVWSLCYLLIFILAIASWIHFYYRFNKGSREVNEDGEWRAANIAIAAITCILSIAISIAAVQNLEPMMTGFFNPEFGAMRNIIQFATQFK